MRFNQFVSEMDSQGYSGSRDKKSHSKYGSRDDYELGEPETTLGPDSIMKPEDVAKQGMSALSKAMKQAHSKGVTEDSDEKQSFKVSYHNPNTRQDKVVKIKARNKDEVLDYCANKGYKDVYVEQGMTEGTNDTVYPNATVIKSRNGKPVGEIYQDGNGWGCFHYGVDRGYDTIDSREDAIQALKDLHQEARGQRPDYTIKGVAEGSGNIGAQIKAAYQKIYDAGDDAIEFAYNDSPIFAQYWDEYEGDLDSIIAEIDPKELQIILDELESAVEDQGIGEAYTVTRGFDKDRYQARPGLEGPFSTKSGKVVYYDKVEGKYYDPDTDMYIEYDDWRAMNEGGSALSRAVREARWGRRSSYYNPMDQERREQDQMDYERRAFKRAEMQHELGHEDDPNFERNLRQQQIDRDRGPWYLRIDGKVYRQKGQPKNFDWKRGANNYALAMIKNNPGLQGKIMLTKSSEDQ